MVIALPALAEILFWMGALIFCLLCVYITKALFGVAGGTLGKLPVIGGWINGNLHSLEQKIVSVMSGAAASTDAHIGAALHRLARVVDWIGREINAHANLIALLGSLLLGAAPTAVLRTLIGELRRLIHAGQTQATHALTRVVKVERVIQRGIGEDVLPRIKTLERDLHGVLGRVIPGLRAGERTAEREITNLWKWTRKHTLVAGTLAFAGAVALALSRLGVGWVRCSKVGRLGRNVCGMDDGLLESLLADTLLIAGTLSLVEFATEMIEVERASAEVMTAFWRAT